jgi:hypothetical protein
MTKVRHEMCVRLSLEAEIIVPGERCYTGSVSEARL